MFQDSKALTEKKRETLLEEIISQEKQGLLLSWIWMGSNKEIDTHWIIKTLQKASLRWIFHLLKKFFISSRWPRLKESVYGEDKIAYHRLYTLFASNTINPKRVKEICHTQNTICKIWSCIIDGNHTFHLEEILQIPITTFIKGDSKNPLISAASIIAKVERDRYMIKVEKKIWLYNFDTHKWYGTQLHRKLIAKHGMSAFHRESFCTNITKKRKKNFTFPAYRTPNHSPKTFPPLQASKEKPKLLLHICCAPDLSRPLHRLKNHFKLYLFWYNPNIHPRKEHTKRYESFIKLIGLEKGDYEIVEDRYDPKEFFDAMIEQKNEIDPSLANADNKTVLTVAGKMEEQSSRCNPCYSMRLTEAAKNAQKYNIPYFTSTLLISPKKKMDKLFHRGLDAETIYQKTKFLRFNFAKNNWYQQASKLTKKHGLFRQNYCWCWRTIPKPGQDTSWYTWG